MYDVHRHASTPRAWPLIGGVALTAGLAWLALGPWLTSVLGLTPALLVSLAVADGGAFIAVELRWRLWRARHPLRPCDPELFLRALDERAATQRKVSPWQ